MENDVHMDSFDTFSGLEVPHRDPVDIETCSVNTFNFDFGKSRARDDNLLNIGFYKSHPLDLDEFGLGTQL